MLTKEPAWKTSDGVAYFSLEGAQVAELSKLLGVTPETAKDMVDDKDTIVDILTTTPRSLAKARRINGGTKKRAPKIKAVPEPDKCQTLLGV